MKPLILGSSSPRRREILSFFTLPFEIIPSAFDEEKIPFDGDPAGYVKTLSECKAGALGALYPNRLILTADTAVYQHGRIFNKPKDEGDAYTMLLELVGDWNQVFTGVTVQLGDKRVTMCEETKVELHALSPEEVRAYHKVIYAADKSGSYTVRGFGGLITKRIEGCFYNVIGLPLTTLRRCLGEMGIDLWEYLPDTPK